MVGDAPLTEKIATFNAVLDFSCADAALLAYAAIAAAMPTNAIVRLPVTLISSSLFGLFQQIRLVIMAQGRSDAGPKPQGRPNRWAVPMAGRAAHGPFPSLRPRL